MVTLKIYYKLIKTKS